MERMLYEAGKPFGSFSTLMNVYLPLMDQVKLQSGKNLIQALTGTIQLADPVIRENNGKVIGISERGISVLFELNTEDAVNCAVNLCQKVTFGNDITKEMILSIGIHYGRIYISPMQCGGFSAPLALSDDLEMTRALSETCRKADASILLSDHAVSRIHGFSNRFGCRKIGLFYRESEKKEHIIYDLFDGDMTEKKYSKRRSRLFFETGVDHFLSGHYLQARSCFIELLKFDRSDIVSKRYISMCDKALSGQSELSAEKYFVRW